MSKIAITHAELDRFGAEMLGYEYRDEERRMGCIHAPGYYKDGVWVKDFTPSTKIELALECWEEYARQISEGKVVKPTIKITFTEYGAVTIERSDGISESCILPDCAHQIMLTLWEVEK